jgi:hypothetical protein
MGRSNCIRLRLMELPHLKANTGIMYQRTTHIHAASKKCEARGLAIATGGKVVSLTHRPHSTPQKHYFSVSGTHFC